MTRKSDLPLLLLDNSSVMTAMNQGEYKCTNLSFEEARSILELYGDDVICGFTNPAIESIIFEHQQPALSVQEHPEHAAQPGRYRVQALCDTVGDTADH